MQRCSGASIKDTTRQGEVLSAPSTLNTSERQRANTEIVLTNKSKRIPALDFTKGALVLIMVLYHWMNYFVMADGSIYKYLRFLTPSFIFITGFLISQVYLTKYKTSGRHVPERLVVRGLKLLGIVLCLNLAFSTVHLNGIKNRVADWSTSDIVASYLVGTSPVAFSILVPIAYLLILSAALLVVSRCYKNIYHVACGMIVGCTLLLELKGIKSGYLQIFSFGMLGISVGYVSIDRIDKLVKRRAAIFFAYLVYLVAITLWDDAYLLQIAGVSLSLAVIYGLGLGDAEESSPRKIAILLGQYSLFAYIAQIVILQILRKTLHPFGAGMGVSGAAFVAGVTCTILSVELLHCARGRSTGLNKLYGAVFS